MNAVEIEQAVSDLASAPFDPVEFPFAFLKAFGNPPTTLKRLRAGGTNGSDIGGVLQRNNIHIKVASEDEVPIAFDALKESPATVNNKAKFILATDGKTFQAEHVEGSDIVVCAFNELHEHFAFFLPLAGIVTISQVQENANRY